MPTSLTSDARAILKQPKVTKQAVDSFHQIENPRHRHLIRTLVQKIHDYVQEVELTEEEWLYTINFLTKTGQMCHDQRQEFILLSDVLGISMLVDEINNQKDINQTPSTVFGPFFVDKMPIRNFADSIVVDGEQPETPLLVKGQIRNTKGEPITNAYIDVWQTADNGMYSGQDPNQKIDNLRGLFISDSEGNYAFKSSLPVSYQIPSDGTVGQLLNYAKRTFWRPAHIHFKIAAEGYQTLVTHLFTDNDEYLGSDAVFGVKEGLIVQPVLKSADEASEKHFGLKKDYYLIGYDFILTRS
ncbi:dioxygenase family protein [Psychrobacter lutiphocae]|uniref:dioxygenase family protein n=1 Tax=Psychrobacter lutiphocae TaxID=540500 RepID=UPI0006863F2A|nr:dioxygenase [Psychrobacter lutiphocae]